MKIKTYPLQFSEEDLNEIAELAKEDNPKGTIKEFIYEAIKEKKKAEYKKIAHKRKYKLKDSE